MRKHKNQLSLFDDAAGPVAPAALVALPQVQPVNRFDIAPDIRGWSDEAITRYQIARDEDSLITWADINSEDMVAFYNERIAAGYRWLEEHGHVASR